ncbi:MAG: hypothetical protein ACRDYU_08790 [Actinomycetes bacterium]
MLTPVLAACGGDEPTVTYAPETARQLRAATADVRAAAEQRKPRAAQAALHRLTRTVADAQADGTLPGPRAERILQAADAITDDLAALPTPPEPTRHSPKDDRRPGPRADKRAHDREHGEHDGERGHRGGGRSHGGKSHSDGD